MRELVLEMRVAARQLGRTPGFTGAAVLVLGLGIGGNAALFALAHSLFLRPLPFTEPERLLRAYGVQQDTNADDLSFSIPKVEHVRRHQDAFAAIAVDQGTALTLTGRGEPTQLQGLRVSANWFEVHGLRPALGRAFRADEEDSGARVAVLGHQVWKERFGGSPAALGATVVLDGEPHTVVGVGPPLDEADVGPLAVWVTRPYLRPGASEDLLQRGLSFLRVVGRLPEGRTPEEAQRRLAATIAGYDRLHGGNADARWGVRVLTVREDLVGDLRPRFVILGTAVAFVLLIACSNVANLLLARFLGRGREIAMRSALGAPAGRIVRLFLCETVLLGLTAGAAAMLVAMGALEVLPRIGAGQLPVAADFGAGWLLLVSALLLALLTGLLVGIYPAWQAVRPNLAVVLRAGGRTMTGGRSQQRGRSALVAAQVALSLLLLVGAGLLTTTFVRLQGQPLGFDPSGVLTAYVILPADRYPENAQRAETWQRLHDRLSELPGVRAVALAQGLPLTANDSRAPYAVDGPRTPPLQERPLGLMRSITPGYFAALGIPLLEGREFTRNDRLGAPEVAILSRATAHQLFPGRSPLGERLVVGAANGGTSVEVVGIVADVRSVEIGRDNDVEVYRPMSQRVLPFAQIAVRMQGDELAAVPRVEEALRSLDALLPLTEPESLAVVTRRALDPQRLVMWLCGVFAAMAVVLAAVGVYSVVSYDVRQRAAEVAVRSMLGAPPASLRRLLLVAGMRPVAAGAVLGAAGALLVGQLIAGQLYQVSAREPLVLGGAFVTLIGAALLACWLPARRSTRREGWSLLRES